MPDSMPRPVMVRAFDLEAGSEVEPHHHDWGQLAYASEGILVVSTPQGSWTVPPARAVWIPPRIDHAIGVPGAAAFRSVYINRPEADAMGSACRVLTVTDLLRQLIRRASHLPLAYDETGPDGRLMQVLLDEINALQEEEPLHLPMPDDARLKRITSLLMGNPADKRTLADLAGEAGSSERTLARLFVLQTGLSFGDWRRRLRLVQSVERLVGGDSVTTVALDMGYESPSAFIAMFRRTLGRSPTAFLGG